MLRQELVEELTKQQRLAKELANIQGPELAVGVFGRTDLEVAKEIEPLRISQIIAQDEPIPEGVEVEEEEGVLTHSETYDSITFNGEVYTLQPRQAAVVKMLHDAVRKGHPAVPGKRILSITFY